MKAKEITAILIEEIERQHYVEGGKLPSESALCARFGVSHMTVRASLDELRNRGLIEKRNGVGSFLTRRAMRKSGVIGLVIPDFAKYRFFTTLRDEVARHCRRLKYKIELVTADPAHCDRDKIISDVRHKVRRLAALRAEGVIFRPYVASGCANANREIVKILHHAVIPVVLVDEDITIPPVRSNCDLVAIDNIACERTMARHLHAMGCRRLAFLSPGGSQLQNANHNNRKFGLAGELAVLGVDEGLRSLSFSPQDQAAVAKVLRGKTRPDAIVCGNDEIASELIRTIGALGKRVPDDVAVAGFDNSERAREQSLTTISQPVGEIASTAFKMLLARIRYPNNDPRTILLDAPLIVRNSTQHPNPSSCSLHSSCL